MEEEITSFNIRVYGLMINSKHEILLSTERRGDFRFTKFPGGGMSFGEGTIDCLKREFMEELGIEIEVIRHYYTTDFFLPSAFYKKDQIFSVYYLVKTLGDTQVKDKMKALDTEEGNEHYLHWEKIKDIKPEDLTFPIDRRVLELLKEEL